MKNLPRAVIAFFLIGVPCLLLIKGVYGSFLFSFSIPLFWQVSFLGKPLSSLGLRTRSLAISVFWGVVSGALLGLLGGTILRLFGLVNYSPDSAHRIQIEFGALSIDISLGKEFAYRLFTMSGSGAGLLLYVLFLIFVIGLGEELLWRGFIQRKIADRVTADKAVWITAALFSLTHIYLFLILSAGRGILLLGMIGIAGAFWGYLYERTGNIWSVAVSHGIAAAFIWENFYTLPS
ncbi:MAG: CPBP family intramembrane glutamic endopeptidase [Candidatus Omnitrophota bacterium]